MKTIRIILCPILFFLCCFGTVLIGILPILMGLVCVIGYSLQPTTLYWNKNTKKEEIKESALMMWFPLVFPFYITWQWIQTGKIDL